MNLRREFSSCWSPALTAAAAWREVDAARGDGEGLCPRTPTDAGCSPGCGIARDMEGEAVDDREGGSEFKSGAMGIFPYFIK